MKFYGKRDHCYLIFLVAEIGQTEDNNKTAFLILDQLQHIGLERPRQQSPLARLR